MTLKEHYGKMIKELVMACGYLILALMIITQLQGREIIPLTTLWAIALLGAAVVFRAESLINFHALEEHIMRLNYMISSVLADITLLLLLYRFTPGGKYFQGKGWVIIFVYILFKGLFYLMVYFKSLMNAREINTRLKEDWTEI